MECFQSELTVIILQFFLLKFAFTFCSINFYFQFYLQLKYGKSYQNETEDKIRMEIFLKNKHKVEEHNEKHAKGSVSFKMGLNKFSDLSPEEVNAQMKGSLRPSLLP